MKRFSMFAAALATTAMVSSAQAQEYLPSTSAQVASGVEGGGETHRARTRLRIGLELRIDESPADGVSFAGLVELEPRAAFGADLRYVRSLGKTFDASGGVIAFFAPATLLGPAAGLTAKVPLTGRKSSPASLRPEDREGSTAGQSYILVGPETAVFVFGSDLPNNTIVWQALLQVGLRADF